MNIYEDNRIGKFKVSEIVMRDNPEGAMRIFRDIIVVKIEYIFGSREFEYHGYSKHFDKCQQYCYVPEYQCLFTYKNGKVRKTWRKIPS